MTHLAADDLPFCADDCADCAEEAAASRALAEAREAARTHCDFHPDVALKVSAHGHKYCDPCEAEISRREAMAEMAAERAWSNRYEYDEEAQRDLAYHNELWPTYYGCPTDPGAAL